MDDLNRNGSGAALLDRSVADALRSCAAPLGVPVAFLEHARVTSVTRTDPTDPTIRTFTRGDVEVISLPASDDADLGEDDLGALLELTRGEAPVGAVVDVRGGQLVVLEDPAAVAIADERTFVPVPNTRAMLVVNPGAITRDELRSAVPAHEWIEGGGELTGVRRVGALAGGMLVAMATAEPADGRLVRLRVIVAPSFRRMGYGRTVLAELARRMLGEGALPSCRLASDNLSANALARAAGFVDFARTLTLQAVDVRDSVLRS